MALRSRPVSPRRSAHVAFVWLVFAGVLVVGWNVLQPAVAQTSTADASDGEFLWKRDCASCHGATGAGTAWGPTIVGEGPAGVSLVLTTGRMPLPPFAEDGTEPRGFLDVEVRRGPVHYTPADIDALVAHSRTILDGPDVPTVDVDGADLANGQELFQGNCAACHTSGGRGGALTTGQVAVSLVDATPTEVVEAMRVGLGTMPVFDRAEIDGASANDVAAYVDYLQTPRTPLGLSLGFIGPVAEGFIAWLVGIVGLLGVVRWIGTRE